MLLEQYQLEIQVKNKYLAMEVDFCQEYISVSKYPFSASNAIGKIINSYEDFW